MLVSSLHYWRSLHGKTYRRGERDELKVAHANFHDANRNVRSAAARFEGTTYEERDCRRAKCHASQKEEILKAGFHALGAHSRASLGVPDDALGAERSSRVLGAALGNPSSAAVCAGVARRKGKVGTCPRHAKVAVLGTDLRGRNAKFLYLFLIGGRLVFRGCLML